MKNKENIDIRKYLGLALAFSIALIIAMLVFFIIDRAAIVGKFFDGIIKTLMPFIIGGCIAYIICPLVNLLNKLYLKAFIKIKEEKRIKLANSFSIYTGIIIAILILVFVVVMIIPNLINSIIRIIQLMPNSIKHFTDWVEKVMKSNEYLMQNSETIINTGYDYAMNFLNNNVLGNINNIITNLTNSVMGVFTLFFNILQ